MEEIIRFVGLCLLTVLLVLTLKGTNPVGAVLVLIGSVAFLTVWNISGLQEVWMGLERLTMRSGNYTEIYLPVVKVIGIAATVQIAGAVCRDAGASSLASQLEMAGACASIVVCLPLFEQILAVADALLD